MELWLHVGNLIEREGKDVSKHLRARMLLRHDSFLIFERLEPKEHRIYEHRQIYYRKDGHYRPSRFDDTSAERDLAWRFQERAGVGSGWRGLYIDQLRVRQ